MISYIRGELAAVQEQKAIVEAGGIGYGIYMSQQTLSMLPAVGEEVKFTLISTCVRMQCNYMDF